MKSKSEIRMEAAEAIARFLATGGVIEQVKAKKIPRSKNVSGKSTRSFFNSSKPAGYPTKSFGA